MKIQTLPNKMMCLVSLLLLTGCGTGSNHNNEVGLPGSYQPIAMNAASSDVISAAEAGLPIFISGIADQWSDFGFANSAELALVELGTPYQICILNNPGKSDQAIAVTEEWHFPVIVNNSYRCILTVARTNDQWQAVSIGSAGFATSLQATETSHPLLNFTDRGIVNVYGFSSSPYEILGQNLSEAQPSFLLLPPATDLVTLLPQYSTWTDSDPVPVLSYAELSTIMVSLRQ